MTRFVVASAAILALVAGCGGGGGGGSTKAPVLTGVSPEVGSPNTIWTLSGEHLSKKSTVLFDGVEATILGVGTGDDPVLMVLASNLAITESQVVDVTVAHGSKRSNPIAVGVVPSGSIEVDARPAIFGKPLMIAVKGELLYVVDANGLWEHDFTSGEIRALVRRGEGGFANPIGVWSFPDGSLWFADQQLNGNCRLFFRTANGLWSSFIDFGASSITAVARDAGTGNIYVVGGTSVDRYSPAGEADGSWNPASLSEPARGAVFQNAKLYVTQPSADEIDQIDATTAAITNFATGVSGDSLVGDGTNLWITSTVGSVLQLSAAAVQTTFFDGNSVVGFFDGTRLARRSNGTILATSLNDDVILSLSNGAVDADVVSGGVAIPIVIARTGNGDHVLMNNNFQCQTDADGEQSAAVVLTRDDGTARIVTTDVCGYIGASVVGNTLWTSNALTTKTSVQRTDLVTGEVTALATSADGFSFAFAIAADPDGNAYVAGYDLAGDDGYLHMIAADGTQTLEIASFPSGIPVTILVLEERILVALLDLNAQESLGVWEVPLGGGVAVEIPGSEDLGVVFDGMAPDGRGGAFTNSYLTAGGVSHIAADGTLTQGLGGISTSEGEVVLGLEREPDTGLIRVSLFDSDNQSGRLATFYP